MYTCICVYIYIYTYIHTYICICIYIYIYTLLGPAPPISESSDGKGASGCEEECSFLRGDLNSVHQFPRSLSHEQTNEHRLYT